MTKRAALYCRTSYWDKQGDSLESQLELCREYAQGRGYEIVTELSEDSRGASGATFDLPALDKALDLARRDRIDVLVTREMDRFARGLAKQLIKEREFQTAGADVEYALGEYDDTPEGQLTKHVRAIIAEYEREKINERMTRGRLRSVRRGNVSVGTNVPFGYRVVKVERDGCTLRTLQLEPDEAGSISLIFRWYVYGDDGQSPLSIRAIARRLSAMGVPTATDRGKNTATRRREPGQWAAETVRYIISSRTYAGEWVYHSSAGDIVVPVDPIVDAALWRRAQRKRATAKQMASRNTQREYLLRGRVVCAACGYRMSAITRTSYRDTRKGRTRYQYGYYLCYAAKRGQVAHKCAQTISFRSNRVDAAVWSELKLLLTDPQRLAAAYEHSRDAENLRHIEEQIERAERRIATLKSRLDRLLDLYLDGQHTRDALHRRQRDIEADIARSEHERDELEQRLNDTTDRIEQMRSVQVFADEFKSRLATADDSFQRRRWLVDVLDVVVQLELTGEQRLAHLEIEGARLATVVVG